jgi:hypothetical protein
VRGYAGGWGEIWFGRIFTLPHTLVGIGALGYLIFLILWRFFGADLPGVVTGSEISHSPKGGTSYTLKYRYQVGEETKSGTDGVSRAVYERFQSKDEPNSRVIVHYFSIEPLKHAKLRESGSLWAEMGFLALWAGFWNFVVSFAVYQFWIKPLRRRRLYRHGEATSGTLIGKRVKSGKSTTYYVTYTFREPIRGEMIVAEMQVWDVGAWNCSGNGQPLIILYAPQNPNRSTVYEFGGYRVVKPEESPKA